MWRSFLERCFGGAAFDQRAADAGLLLLRVHVGYTMMRAGLDKFPTEAWFLEQVTELGFPLPHLFAWLACFSEFGGGVLLMLGLLSRPAAFLIAVTMGVAAFRFHGEPVLFSMHISQIYFWACFFFTVAGGGRFSMDFAVRSLALPGPEGRARFPSLAALPLPILAVLVGIAAVAERAEVEEETAREDIVSVHLAGNLNDWDVTATPLTTTDSNRWETTLDIAIPGPLEFKLVGNQSWDINWGMTGAPPGGMPATGIAVLDDKGDTSNLIVYIPSSGVYRVLFSLDDFTFEVAPATP
jgi:putative oxidoreductase